MTVIYQGSEVCDSFAHYLYAENSCAPVDKEGFKRLLILRQYVTRRCLIDHSESTSSMHLFVCFLNKKQDLRDIVFRF